MSDFKPLSTANLPDPVIDPAAGKEPADYFNTVLYTGTGAAVDINTVGFQPDLVWGKKRSAPNQNNWLIDSVRGAGVWLASDGTGSEGTEPAGSSFDADGFNTNSNSLFTYNGGSYVLWAWKANGSGVSNTDGSITSTVSANTTSGFSVVPGDRCTNESVGHGLNQAPEMYLGKNRRRYIIKWAWELQTQQQMAFLIISTASTAVVIQDSCQGFNVTAHKHNCSMLVQQQRFGTNNTGKTMLPTASTALKASAK